MVRTVSFPGESFTRGTVTSPASAANAPRHPKKRLPTISGANPLVISQAFDSAGHLYASGEYNNALYKAAAGQSVTIVLDDEIAKGSFGKITRVRHSNCHAGSLKGWFDTDWRWMADPKIAGVGACVGASSRCNSSRPA